MILDKKNILNLFKKKKKKKFLKKKKTFVFFWNDFQI